jgi:hypothetical protein
VSSFGDSIESVLSALNQTRLDRIAERKKLRDSIIVHHDYDMFEAAFADVHEKARKRWEKLNERNTSKDDSGESSEATDGSERSETSDDA